MEIQLVTAAAELRHIAWGPQLVLYALWLVGAVSIVALYWFMRRFTIEPTAAH